MGLRFTKRNLNITERKSLGMNTSFLKSPKSDLKKSDSGNLLLRMDVIAKNILHLTYQNDRILALLSSLVPTKEAHEFYNRDDEPSEEVENL